MELNDVQRALITRALDKLAQDDAYTHSIALIRRIAGEQVVEEVRTLHTEYRNANAAAKDDSGAMLSAEAADYWQEARGVLAYGRLVNGIGSRAAEKRLSLKCEALHESFDARVPDCEKGKFIQFDVSDAAENWDERWHYTIDFAFPLLASHFNGSVPIKNPMAEAQRTVLRGLLEERGPASPCSASSNANVSRLSKVLRSIADDRSAEEKKLADKVARQKLAAVNAEKNARKKELAQRRKAKIAAGDQQATKNIRAKQFKIVPGIFE